MPPLSKAAEHEEEKLLSKTSKPKGGRGGGLASAAKPKGGRGVTKQATARAANMSFRLPNKGAVRDKGLGTQHRNWIKIQKDGTMTHVQLKQHQLMHQLGIQPRDLRLLDLLVATSYPSAILSRDCAIVVNLERFKCIITMDTILLPAALFDEEPDAFLQELQKRLRASSNAGTHAAQLGRMPLYSADEPRAAGADLPFELCALEVCLEALAQHLGECTSLLEARAGPFYEAPHPAKINSDYLEAIKVIKTRCVRLKTRAETVKEVLQKYLDDEEDLKDLYLSARMGKAAPWDTESALWEQIEEELNLKSNPSSLSDPGPISLTPAAIALLNDPEKEQAAVVERVLRPYLMHLDQIVERLIDINDHIEDTEEYMGLSLNTTRNILVWLRVMVNSATFLTTLLFALGNLMGQNLGNHDADWTTHYGVFLAVSISMSLTALLLYATFVIWLQSTVNKAFVGGSLAPQGWLPFRRPLSRLPK